MALEQYLNGENIKASTQPIDAIQLLAEDKEIIETEQTSLSRNIGQIVTILLSMGK